MPFYRTFTSTRTTVPDIPELIDQLKASDATAGLQYTAPNSYVVKKATAFTAGQITFVQNLIDTVAANTAQRIAQHEIDQWPISVKALVLTLIDEINNLRANLPTPQPAITASQAIAAIRTKAGAL